MSYTLVFLARRRDELTHEEFLAHWRDHHGPLVREHLGHHLLSYRQLHATVDGRFDGAAVLEFASPDAFAAFLADPAYAAVVEPDEDAFLDKSRSAMVLCDEEHPIIGAERR